MKTAIFLEETNGGALETRYFLPKIRDLSPLTVCKIPSKKEEQGGHEKPTSALWLAGGILNKLQPLKRQRCQFAYFSFRFALFSIQKLYFFF